MTANYNNCGLVREVKTVNTVLILRLWANFRQIDTIKYPSRAKIQKFKKNGSRSLEVEEEN